MKIIRKIGDVKKSDNLFTNEELGLYNTLMSAYKQTFDFQETIKKTDPRKRATKAMKEVEADLKEVQNNISRALGSLDSIKKANI